VPRVDPGVAALGLRLVIAGGIDTGVAAGNEITKRVDVYDTTTMQFSQLPDAPVALVDLQLAGAGTTLYLLGGLAGPNGAAVGQAWKLDTLAASPSWQPIAPMPAGQERGAAAVVGSPNRVYLLGGSNLTTALASCIDYEIATDSWRVLADLPAARAHAAAMIRSDSTLVIAGGFAGVDPSTAIGDVSQLPPGAMQWQSAAPMPHPRGSCAYGAILGQLVCAGGEAGGPAASDTELYDPFGNAWIEGTPIPAPTTRTPGSAVANRLYVPGGARMPALEPTSTLYIYAPLDTTMP
jgi:hypothetical protein